MSYHNLDFLNVLTFQQKPHEKYWDYHHCTLNYEHFPQIAKIMDSDFENLVQKYTPKSSNNLGIEFNYAVQ